MRLSWIAVVVVACKGGQDKPNMDDASVVDPDASIDALPDAYEVIGSTAMSGTRLKVAWATTPDGIKIDVPTFDSNGSYDFYDSVFAKACRIEKWSDGVMRCTPSATRVVYADAQCTMPRAIERFLTTLDPIWVERAANTAASVDQLYTVASQVAETQYWEKVGQTCAARSISNGDKLYGLTAAMLPIVSEATAGTGTLKQSWLTSSDGLQVPRRAFAYDATIGRRCTLRTNTFVNPIEPGECELTFESRLYHDTVCATPVYKISPGQAVPTYVSSACSRKVHTLGTMTTASPLSTRGGVNQACGTIAPSAGDTFYLFGPEIGEEQIATLVPESTPGHRLQPITYGNVGIWSGYFHDTVLDLDCALTKNGCRPYIAPTRRVYTDAACTVGIDVVQIGTEFDPACPARRPPSFARDANNLVHAVGAQHVGTLKVKAGSNCDPISFETPPDQRFFDLDPASITDSAFETAAYSIDP